MKKNSTIFITGGTGSFGNTFVKLTLQKYNPKKIIIFSRDEMKQWEMRNIYSSEKRLQFIIGDVRDGSSLSKAMSGADYVVHAAATKIVPLAEYNPFECIKTNINGAMNVINASIENKIPKVVGLSTDKASNPINLYGATKLAADKLFIAGNNYFKKNSTKFSIVRYGNVMGSRGSVIPLFIKQSKNNLITITEENMTRFMISLEDAVKSVWDAFNDMHGGEIYIKKIPSMKVVDIAKSISSKVKLKVIGIRPGEKIHEQMISIEDAPHTYEYSNYFKILPSLHNLSKDKKRIKKGKKVSKNFCYNSFNNKNWMNINQLKLWIKNNKNIIGKI